MKIWFVMEPYTDYRNSTTDETALNAKVQEALAVYNEYVKDKGDSEPEKSKQEGGEQPEEEKKD